MRRLVDAYRGIISLAWVTAFRLNEKQQTDMLIAVATLDDDKHRLRAATFRDKPLRLSEYAEIAIEVSRNVNAITSDTDIKKMITKVQTKRWARWQLQAGYTEHRVAEENGMLNN